MSTRQVLHLEEGEVVVRLADGWSLRCGAISPDVTTGEWLRLVRPDGIEYAYWHYDEWRDDPVLVMGAAMNAASGFRPQKVPR